MCMYLAVVIQTVVFPGEVLEKLKQDCFMNKVEIFHIIIEQQYLGKDFDEIAMTVHEGRKTVDCRSRALYRQSQHNLSSRK